MRGTSGPTCLTKGCNRSARRGVIGYGGWCERCRYRWRQHGAVNQVPILKPELEKYVKRINRVLKRGANLEKIETSLRESANVLKECAEAVKVGSPTGT